MIMNAAGLAAARPFEICSIRPPTENHSLTFRLVRNCYWKKCAFCPIYKTGARFKKRPAAEIKQDVANARVLNELVAEKVIGTAADGGALQNRASQLVESIRQAKSEAGEAEPVRRTPLDQSPDPRIRWFSSWFIDYPDISDCVEHLLAWRLTGARTCFLGDADALILKPAYIEEIMACIKENFPELKRFTVYGRTATAARHRRLQELEVFRNAGIDRVHFGVESGSARVLKRVNKGAAPEDHVEGALKTSQAGLSCSFYIMPGLGGTALSQAHAAETARVINRAKPDYVRLRTLEIFNGTPLDLMRQKGEFTEADDDTVVREIKRLLQEITAETELLSDSATNLLQINGRLPMDRQRMLAQIDDYLCLGPRERIEYSFRTRLAAFAGQYGGLSGELMDALSPVLKDGRLDPGPASDAELKQMTAFVKSRLMP